MKTFGKARICSATIAVLMQLFPTTIILSAIPCHALKSAVVVGGGPTGLAAALVLSRKHNYSVTVLESEDRTDKFDPTKAYPFLIKSRGQKFTQRFPDVQQSLEEKGIPTEGISKIVSVPADPNVIFDPTPQSINMAPGSRKNFWLRRHEFNELMLNAVKTDKNIKLVTCTSCDSVVGLSDTEIQVTAKSTKQTNDQQEPVTTTYRASLVVAADGMKSRVRECLQHAPTNFPGWKNSKVNGFNVKRWMSPASGLKFKSLHMNSNATVPVGDGTEFTIPFDTPTFFALRSVFKKPTNAISLGVLPARWAPTRTFNVIRIPKHDIWKIRNGDELREWFSKAFPRFDFSTDSSLVKQEEFDRFAASEGLQLPACQYTTDLFVSSPSGESAVVLIGDAVHAFPPDIGEGVNAGLEDVAVFDDSMSKHEKLGDAIEEYASLRGPAAKALIRIARFGAPFQYGQFGGMLTVRKAFWSINFVFRLMLHKLTRGVTPLPIMSQLTDPNLKYTTIVRRSDTFTAILWTLTTALLLQAFGVFSKLKVLLP